MFHALTLHGGSGRLREDRGLEVFGVNWVGDDVRVCTRPGGTNPDLTSACAVYGLADGDPLACDAFPVTWSRT